MNFNVPNTAGTHIINPIFSGSVATNINNNNQTAKNLALSKVYLRKNKKIKNDEVQSRYLTQNNNATKQTNRTNIRAELNIRSDYGDSPVTGRQQNNSINYD
jgi:hypothetical protein